MPICGCALQPLSQPCRALWWSRELSPQHPNSTVTMNGAPAQKKRWEPDACFSPSSLKAAMFLTQCCIFQTRSLLLSRWSPHTSIREMFFLWLYQGQDSAHEVLKDVSSCNWCGTILSTARPPETKSTIKRYKWVWIPADSNISHSEEEKKQAQRALQTKTMPDTCLNTWIAVLCGDDPSIIYAHLPLSPHVQSNSITESLVCPSEELCHSFLLHLASAQGVLLVKQGTEQGFT